MMRHTIGRPALFVYDVVSVQEEADSTPIVVNTRITTSNSIITEAEISTIRNNMLNSGSSANNTALGQVDCVPIIIKTGNTITGTEI